mmetsp:Transcript_44605/g.93606  ORF Transcript_44605/g.93606 Transcript_44605/m.93606 type:complete len:234 (+) Transcript_44605:49-750(+)
MIQFFILKGNVCPYAHRTYITLLELRIPFDLVEIEGSGAHKPDWFLKINPLGKVPSLAVPTTNETDNDYFAVYESAICNEFLCDYASMTLQREHRLMPANDPFARATIRLLNNHGDVFVKSFMSFLRNVDDAEDEELRNKLEAAVAKYEDTLVTNRGPYLLGKEYTMADVHIFPFMRRLVITLKHFKDYEMPREKFPNVLSWLDACFERESAKKSSLSPEKTIESYTRLLRRK